jgi:hypothetical protein
VGYHQANAQTAAENHAICFGSNTVRYRANANCAWVNLPGAVVHGEFERWIRKGNPQTTAKVIERMVFVEGAEIALNSQLQTGDCTHTYTVTESKQKGTRYGLTCQRSSVQEITRPGYRRELGGQ